MATVLGSLLLAGLIVNKASSNNSEVTETKKREHKLERYVRELSNTEIVNDIIHNKIPNLDKDVHRVTNIFNNSDDVYVDHSREYKDMCTKLIVERFLGSDESMFNFLELVYGNFYESIEEYKTHKGLDKTSIIFVYKGGNVLRIISNDFTRELPRSATKKIEDYYKKYFKRSDADFSIYVNPNIAGYNRIFKDMTHLAYLLQVKIRQIIRENITDYFDYFKYSDIYKTQILRQFADELKDSEAIIDTNNPVYFNKVMKGVSLLENSYPEGLSYSTLEDKGYQFQDGSKKKKSVSYLLQKTDSIMYIQMNETLDFSKSSTKVKFTLVRTKINFNIHLEDKVMNIGGELIDISIPHKDNKEITHFYENPSFVKRYQLKYNDRDLIFYSYSIDYLKMDLERMLYSDINVPWEDAKYQKRLNRVFYMYIIDMFVHLKDGSRRREILEALRDKLFSKKISLTNLDQDITVIYKNIISLQYQIPDRLNINTLINKIQTIFDHSEMPGFVEEYNLMIDILNENCKYMLDAMGSVRDFCSNEARIDMKALYDGDFSSLMGGMRRKKK